MYCCSGSPPDSRTGLARGESRQVLLRDDVSVHAVQAALDDTELDEAAHVDVAQHFDAGVHVHLEPLEHGPADAEASHEAHEHKVLKPTTSSSIAATATGSSGRSNGTYATSGGMPPPPPPPPPPPDPRE